MAAVIRVKRKRTADPADTLILSCKRSKQNSVGDSGYSTGHDDISNLFRFAGTVRTRNEPADKIQSAIEAAKENYKKSGHKPHVELIHSKIRELRKSSSLSSRYKVVSSHRDIVTVDEDSAVSDAKNSDTPDLGNDGKTDKGSVHDNKENSVSTLQECSNASAIAGGDDTEKEISRLCCLYDVVQEEAAHKEHTKKPSPDRRKAANQDVLMCNNVQMIREKLTIEDETKPRAIEPEYVYDLYYADPSSLDMEALKNIVSIVGYSEQEFVHEDDDEDRVNYHGDYDDDSNDESNWRNDYPDEDPHFYAEDGEFDYEYGGYHGNRELSSDDYDDDDENMQYRHRRINYEYEVQDYEDDSDDGHDGFLV